MEEQEQSKEFVERRTRSVPIIITDNQGKWLMGIVAAVLGGILIGWYNDVRDLKPDVAVLKTQVGILTEQVKVTNQRLETLTEVLIRREEREARK